MLLVINSAKKELDIYNEEMEDSVITDALMSAARRGIIVNIVMTYQSAAKLAFEQLKNAGANLHLFHGEKFYIKINDKKIQSTSSKSFGFFYKLDKNNN